MINIDLYDPDFIINCRDLRYPGMVYELMRVNGIKRAYVYGMVWQPKLLTYDFIKVGMSAPKLEEKRGYQVGERLVRQVSWLPGWDAEPVKSSHGSDFWQNILRFAIPQNKLPQYFNKNMLGIAVWDISKRKALSDFLTDDEELASAAYAEGMLAKQYKNLHENELPPLNYIDPSQNSVFQGHVSKSSYTNLFAET